MAPSLWTGASAGAERSAQPGNDSTGSRPAQLSAASARRSPGSVRAPGPSPAGVAAAAIPRDTLTRRPPPGRPPAGGRVYLEDLVAQLNKRFDPEAKFINYYNDPANNQLHLDTARLQTLGFSLKEVAAFLEGLDVFEAAFTEDEVKAAQARLPKL